MILLSLQIYSFVCNWGKLNCRSHLIIVYKLIISCYIACPVDANNHNHANNHAFKTLTFPSIEIYFGAFPNCNSRTAAQSSKVDSSMANADNCGQKSD